MSEYKYSQCKVNGKKQLKHRAVMELCLGRKLRTDEYVHHINGSKKDNRIENLEIMSPIDHGREHHLKYPISKPCQECGQIFTPHKTKRKRAKTCSFSCAKILRVKTCARTKSLSAA